mmetsp:Transcript_23398/g.54115  ORF Transcript_23398/g.54115 Transcript_23398/m.54115 type:complete len:253 (-) Transcript_23398:49-807(-)
MNAAALHAEAGGHLDLLLDVAALACRPLQSTIHRATVALGALLHDHVVGDKALPLLLLHPVLQGPLHAVEACVALAFENAHVVARLPPCGSRNCRRSPGRRRNRGRGRSRLGRRLCNRRRRRCRRLGVGRCRLFHGRRGLGQCGLGLDGRGLHITRTTLAVLLATPLLPLGGPQVLPIVVLGVAIVQPERRVVRLFHLGRGRRPILHSSHLPQGELEVPGAIRVCNVALLEGRDKQGAGGDQHHGTQTAGHC